MTLKKSVTGGKGAQERAGKGEREKSKRERERERERDREQSKEVAEDSLGDLRVRER